MDLKPLDCNVVGGTIVTSLGQRQADVGIKDGRIAALALPGTLPLAETTIDASGRYVIPGLVDPHTHPGNTVMLADDIGTETLSAAIGGVTTINAIIKSTRMTGLFKPLTTREDAISYLKAFPDARRACDELAHVDVAFTFIIMTDEHAAEIPACAAELGVTSFKLMPSAELTSPWGARVGIPVFPDDGTVFLALRNTASSGGLAMLHCENQQISRILEPEARSKGHDNLASYAEKSPPALEAFAVWHAGLMAREVGCPVYVVHLSSGAGLAAVVGSRAQGVPIIAETCPQYFMAACDDPKLTSLLKMSPPVHTRADGDLLWGGLQSGAIQCVGSDHVPHLREKKQGGIWKASPGGPGVATLLPLLLSEGVNKGRLTFEQVVTLTSLNPALALGLYPQKGSLEVGADADLVIVDLKATRRVTAENLYSSSDFSPFEGMVLQGWPTLTMLRGHVVMADGRPTGDRWGLYVGRRTPVPWKAVVPVGSPP